MGRTYNNQSRRFDDDFSSGRSGKAAKHSNNRKSGGIKTLNSYAEEDYDNLTFDSEDDLINDDSADTNT